MLVGYARVSTADQNLDLQRDALAKEGVGRVFADVASGKRDDRPGLAKALAAVKAGDTLVVWRLDRLGRSLRHLIETVSDLQARGVDLRVLTGGIDTSTSTGRMVFGIFASLGEYERELVRERTLAGLAAARSRGRVGGRRCKLTTGQVAHAREMLPTHTVKDIAAILGCARSTVYAALDREPINPTRVFGHRRAAKAVMPELPA